MLGLFFLTYVLFLCHLGLALCCCLGFLVEFVCLMCYDKSIPMCIFAALDICCATALLFFFLMLACFFLLCLWVLWLLWCLDFGQSFGVVSVLVPYFHIFLLYCFYSSISFCYTSLCLLCICTSLNTFLIWIPLCYCIILGSSALLSTVKHVPLFCGALCLSSFVLYFLLGLVSFAFLFCIVEWPFFGLNWLCHSAPCHPLGWILGASLDSHIFV